MNRFASGRKATLEISVHRNAETGSHEIVGKNSDWVEQVRRFLAAIEARGLSHETVAAYAYDIVALSRWLAETQQCLEQLEEADLLDFIGNQRKRHLKPTSINRRLTTIEAFYRFVTGESLPRRRGVSVPAASNRGRGYGRLGVHRVGRATHRALRIKQPKAIINPLTKEQVKLLLATFERYRDIALVYLMLLCGLRSLEVLTIEINDINADDGSLCVHGKGKKQRLLPLPRPVSSTIAAYLRLERPRHCLTQRLFVVLKGRRRGYPMTRAGLRSLFRHRRLHPSLKNANPHRLRHTFGLDMARAGMQLPALQRLMGHSDSNTTIGYINLSLDDIAEAYHEACEKIRRNYET